MKKIKSLLAVLIVFSMLFAVGCSNDDSLSNVHEEDSAYDAPDRDTEEDAEENSEGDIDTSNLPEIPGVDIAYEIEYFVESSFNTHTIKVGEGHTPLAANWTQVGGKCYTTDESVAEVAKNGNVFGRGAGVAYIVITGLGGTYEIYKYNVVG